MQKKKKITLEDYIEEKRQIRKEKRNELAKKVDDFFKKLNEYGEKNEPR